MRRALPLAVLLALTAALAFASPALAAGRADVHVAITGEGAEVTVELDRAVKSFRFAEADVTRDGEFRIETPGLTLEGNTLSAKTPFRKFAFLVPPFAAERDANYPTFYRLGQGAVLYAPALLGDKQEWDTELSFDLPEGYTFVPAGDAFEDGFVFVGPDETILRDPSAWFVFDPATPDWLRKELRHTVDGSLAEYRRTLGLPLDHVPLVLVKHTPEGQSSFVGDVTDNAVTSLRFYSPDWEQEDSRAVGRIRGFVLHEAFHFWNGGLAGPDEDAPVWLHEGGADYAAVLTAYALGWSDDAAVEDDLTSDLGQCHAELAKRGEPALDEIEVLPAEIRYSCGPLLQWIVDLEMRRRGTGETVMDAWRRMLDGAVETGRDYTVADFAAQVGVEKLADIPAVALLLEESGAERWEKLNTLLGTMGARVEIGSTGSARSIALMMHLLRSNCTAVAAGSRYGFNNEGGRFSLQTPEGCGTLSGDEVITGFEGEASALLTEAKFAEIARKCANGEEIALDTLAGGQLAAPCRPGLAEPAKQIVVKRWKAPDGG